MATIIRIKRRLAGDAGAPPLSTMSVGELAFNEVDNTLYIGVSQAKNTENTTLSSNSLSGA